MHDSEALLWLGLALATAHVEATRFAGLDHLLPHVAEPDQYLVARAELLSESGRPKTAPLVFHWYPSLLAQAVSLTPVPEIAAAREDPRPLEEQLAAASEPVLRVQRLVALLSLLAVLAALRLRARPTRASYAPAVALAYVIPYSAALSLYSLTWARFLLPVLPYLSLPRGDRRARALAARETADPRRARARAGGRGVGAVDPRAPGLCELPSGALRNGLQRAERRLPMSARLFTHTHTLSLSVHLRRR